MSPAFGARSKFEIDLLVFTCLIEAGTPQLKRERSLRARFCPSQWELSQYLKYMARSRIREFESSHPSHAVGSLWAVSALGQRNSQRNLIAGRLNAPNCRATIWHTPEKPPKAWGAWEPAARKMLIRAPRSFLLQGKVRDASSQISR
jgi:hypothetical protein